MSTKAYAELKKAGTGPVPSRLRSASGARSLTREDWANSVEATELLRAPSAPGHNFARLPLLAPQAEAAFESCPIAAPSPQACPFGGACHECPAPLQAKLTVSQPGDRFEQEADRVAEEVIHATEAPSAQNLSGSPSQQVQRRCARCEEEDEKLQAKAEASQEADGASARSATLPGFSGGGQPLDGTTRHTMESGFGYNFGGVRVHTDERAADAARCVRALAFTLGPDIVFGADAYAPATREGKRLLAHELAHVVQQRAVSRDGASASPTRELSAVDSRCLQRTPLEDRLRLGSDLRFNPPPPPPLFYPGEIREAYVLPAIPAVPELRLELGTTTPRPFRPSYGLDLQLNLSPPLFSPVTIIPVPRCVPDRSLTWNDFTGTPTGSASNGAFTSATISERDVQGNVMFQAVLNSGRSWVRAKYKDPTNRSVNGGAAHVRSCEQYFQGLSANQTGTWNFPGTPSTQCAASIVPSATEVATSRSECSTIVGSEYDRAMEAESARLLQHEQTHFDIACVLAGKADDALAAGADLATVRQRVNALAQPTQTQYDTATTHGCNASAQATWESDVASGLPSITIP